MDRTAIVQLDPGEPSDFEAIEPTITVVVKMPSVAGDKYPAVLPPRPEGARS